MTTQARDQNENVNPSKAADGEANARDRSDTRVEDRIQEARDDVFDRVDVRRQSQWRHAATGQNGDEADDDDDDDDAEILNE